MQCETNSIAARSTASNRVFGSNSAGSSEEQQRERKWASEALTVGRASRTAFTKVTEALQGCDAALRASLSLASVLFTDGNRASRVAGGVDVREAEIAFEAAEGAFGWDADLACSLDVLATAVRGSALRLKLTCSRRLASSASSLGAVRLRAAAPEAAASVPARVGLEVVLLVNAPFLCGAAGAGIAVLQLVKEDLCKAIAFLCS